MLGSPTDLLSRLQRFLPGRWFPSDPGTRIYAILNGFASALSVNFGQMAYAKLQSRIGTATDAFLDGQAADWLGDFPRRLNESDDDYRVRIKAEIVRPRNTRESIYLILLQLTGNIARIFRPSYVFDTGGYGTYSFGYGVAGAWGSYQAPFQALISIGRGTAPGSEGAPLVYTGAIGGWGSPISGYGIGSVQWGDGAQQVQGAVTDDEIYAAVASVTPAGHINWVAISG